VTLFNHYFVCHRFQTSERFQFLVLLSEPSNFEYPLYQEEFKAVFLSSSSRRRIRVSNPEA
jgi:hypothetical protein